QGRREGGAQGGAAGGGQRGPAPEGGLDPEEAEEAGGVSYRPRPAGAERRRRQPGRNSRSAPAGGATGGARKIPGIARLAEESIVGRAAPSEFRQVRPADEDRPSRAQAAHARRVFGRDEFREEPRPICYP